MRWNMTIVEFMNVSSIEIFQNIKGMLSDCHSHEFYPSPEPKPVHGMVGSVLCDLQPVGGLVLLFLSRHVI